jgi:hypothetical protein
MVGRNGMFSGYKSQRTKGQGGLEKKKTFAPLFLLKETKEAKEEKKTTN